MGEIGVTGVVGTKGSKPTGGKVDENTYVKERDLQRKAANRAVDLFVKPYPDADNSDCIPEKQNEQDESLVNKCPSIVAVEEAADTVNTTLNHLGKKQFDDNGNFPEGNRTLGKKIEKNYIWAHAGISDYASRNRLFDSQFGKTPVCLIKATHENSTVQLRASCLGSSEKWNDVEEIPMRTIMEEAPKIIWAKPSVKIIELIEQFKKVTTLYEEKLSLFYSRRSDFDFVKFKSEQILKLAAIYSKMHPESMYPHFHEHWYHFPERYFGVHT